MHDFIGDVLLTSPLPWYGASDVVTESVRLTEGSVGEAVMAAPVFPDFHTVNMPNMLIGRRLLENVPIIWRMKWGLTDHCGRLFTASHSRRTPDNLIDLLMSTYYCRDAVCRGLTTNLLIVNYSRPV
jgi:hypothetical protein